MNVLVHCSHQLSRIVWQGHMVDKTSLDVLVTGMTLSIFGLGLRATIVGRADKGVLSQNEPVSRTSRAYLLHCVIAANPQCVTMYSPDRVLCRRMQIDVHLVCILKITFDANTCRISSVVASDIGLTANVEGSYQMGHLTGKCGAAFRREMDIATFRLPTKRRELFGFNGFEV